MHLFSPEIGLMGTSGIVGPCILQACGGGYSSKILKNGSVAVAFFGDGAVNNGAFHEGLNMAAIWKLPVLFVCENNQYATEVPFSYSSSSDSVASRAANYSMSGYQLDGNDVVGIYRAAEEAVARARKGGGPSLLECKTYRTRPHAEGMGDFTYRTREEVDQWKLKCPLIRLKSHPSMSDIESIDLSSFDTIDQEVKQLVLQSRVQAQTSPEPSEDSAMMNIYAPARSVPNEPLAKPNPARVISFSQATLEALSEEMASNPNIFVMGEGIGVRGGNFVTTKGLYDLYGPERLCDTPICERGFVGLACGAAMTGTRPVIDFMFADFVLDGFGEIINQIAKMQYMSSGRLRMPVLLRGCIGIGHSAATHHSGSYYGMLAQVPGLRVVVPSMASDAKGLLKHALRCDDPVLFLEHRELLQTKEAVPEGDYEIEFGKARVLREGSSVTVVALARMVHLTLSVCDSLESQGISVELIDPRTVNPLDTQTILVSLTKTGRLLVVDEAPGHCGFSAEIAARMADVGFDQLDAPIKRVTGEACPTPYSPSLEKMVVPSADTIARAIRELVEE
jgi:2-oxoisovalerate dehydrogenase E1 component